VQGYKLVAVYGAAQEEEKEDFLSELVHTCTTENLPLIVCGDFNIIRSPNEKTIIDIMTDDRSYLML
jgi:exonuclease III